MWFHLASEYAQKRVAGHQRNSYGDDPGFWGLSPFVKILRVKEENEKVNLKLNNQKTKIMSSGPITSWQIDGETVATVVDFIFGAPKSLQMVIAAMKLKYAYS